MKEHSALQKIAAFFALFLRASGHFYSVVGIDSRAGSFTDVSLDTQSKFGVVNKILKKISLPSDLACSQKCFADEKCIFKKFSDETKLCTLYQSLSNTDLAIDEIKKIKYKYLSPTMTAVSQSDQEHESRNYTIHLSRIKVGISKTSENYVYRNCQEALEANNNISNSYKVQPSMQHGPVLIKCVMESDGRAFALFNHDTESERTVTGYPDKCGGYKHSFVYRDDMETITLVVNNSIHCEQLTKAICKGVVFVGQGCSWLIGRNAQKLSYWGGGPANGTGCACGISNSCINPSRKCNCDYNDNNSVQMDTGYVVEKDALPLTGIALGDTMSRDVEVVKYTVGPLRCIW
eukprot:gene13222-4040_t